VGESVVSGRPTGEQCIKIFVRQKLPADLLHVEQRLPRRFRIADAVVLADVVDLDKPGAPPPFVSEVPDPRKFFSIRRGFVGPPRMGESGSNVITSAGTLGVRVKQAGGSNEYGYFLSCNHVLAAYNEAVLGSAVVQPAPILGGQYPQDVFGRLASFVPLSFGPYTQNVADAAFGAASYRSSSNIVSRIGPVAGTVPMSAIGINTLVRKHGAGTGLTTGRIVAIYAYVKVDYWPLGPAGADTIFSNQIIADCGCAFGDSGSILFDENNLAFGMLFAGSSQYSFFNPLELLLTRCGLDV
jgi:hypothetical protein